MYLLSLLEQTNDKVDDSALTSSPVDILVEN
jgi:hypothetical protein